MARFTPGATGLLTDDIELTYNDGTGPATATRAVEGTGITPALLSMNQTDPYNFGVVAVGGVGEVTIEITNGGDSIALGMGGTLTPPYAFKDGAYPGTGGDCAFSLPGGGATCEIVVTFSPTTVEPINDQTLAINYDNGAITTSVTKDLEAESRTAAVIDIAGVTSSNPENFGTIAAGGTESRELTLTNNGSVDATVVAGAALALPFEYTGGVYPGGGTCVGPTTTLAPGASCTVFVSYSPTSNGLNTSDFIVNYDDGAGSVSSCLLYTSPSPRDRQKSRMPSSA